MNMQKIRGVLETQQIIIYFGAVVIAITIAMFLPRTTVLENGLVCT